MLTAPDFYSPDCSSAGTAVHRGQYNYREERFNQQVKHTENLIWLNFGHRNQDAFQA